MHLYPLPQSFSHGKRGPKFGSSLLVRLLGNPFALAVSGLPGRLSSGMGRFTGGH